MNLGLLSVEPSVLVVHMVDFRVLTAFISKVQVTDPLNRLSPCSLMDLFIPLRFADDSKSSLVGSGLL